jgi:hypothetical protein
MGHVPDHTPAAEAVEHAALIAALDAGDLVGTERERAADLAGACIGCASLLADLALIRVATAALPAPPRRRDYRLTDADASRLRTTAWGRLVGWLGAPRSTVRPFAGALVTLGIAGLLLTTTPGIFGQAATTLSTGAPVLAPGAAEGVGGGAGGNAGSNAAPGTPAGPAAAPTLEPATTAAPGALSAPGATPAPGAVGAMPGAAALPAPSPAAVGVPVPSPAAVAVPAPSAPSTTRVLAGPAATPGPSGFSTNTGAMDTAPKAAPPEASPAQRNAALPAASEPAPPDRTLPLALSLALLVAGIGLLAANRLLRRRARA